MSTLTSPCRSLLHANVVAPAGDRERLERLCRYGLRPPIAQDRLRLTSDGQVLLQLRRRWADGTTHLLFDPIELLERLAALTPRPRVNLVLYYGVLGPRARWRPRVVVSAPRADPGGEERSCGVTLQPPHDGREGLASAECASEGARADARFTRATPEPQTRQGSGQLWADLMRRAFGFDVLGCPRCGGRMRLVATIEQREVIERILRHLGLPTDLPAPRPARAPPLRDEVFDTGADLPVYETKA